MGADGSYWTDVRSDPIQVVVTDSKDVVVQPALVAAQSGLQTDAEVKSRARVSSFSCNLDFSPTWSYFCDYYY